jgi:hypothetical protein
VSDTVHGYGADAELVGSTLRLTATGKIGRGALGTDMREIDVPTAQAAARAHRGSRREGDRERMLSVTDHRVVANDREFANMRDAA